MHPGQLLENRYRLERLLGEGGMGAVYLAVDESLQQQVALKTLLPALASDVRAIEKMKREVRTAQRLRHESICATFDFRDNGGKPFVVMEYVEGDTLSNFIYRQPNHRCDEGTFRRVAEQIVVAVEHAHKAGVIHRDLKPANIQVKLDGSIRVMDFGIAASLKEVASETTGSAVTLSIRYASPEQINGEPAAPSMDIYSLGCVFYEMLSGEAPFPRGDVLHQHLTRKPTPIPGVAESINKAILWCLEKDPRQRCADLKALHDLLMRHNFVDTDRTVRIDRDRTVQLRKPAQWIPLLETGPLSPSIRDNERISEQPVMVNLTSRPTVATDASLGRPLLPDAVASSAIRPLEPPSFGTSRPRKNKALILTVASVMLFIGGSIYSVVENPFGFMDSTDLLATDFGALKAGGVVSDFFTVLDPSDRAQLEHLSDDLQKQTGAQLAFVIVKSLGKQPIEAVSKQIFDTFVVGRQGVNDGVMVLLSSDDHDSRILFGEGLNPALSAQSPHILDEMRTSLQSGKFGAAMLSAASKLRDAIVNAKRQGQTQSMSEPPLQATSPESQAEWGRRYYTGDGVLQDLSKAFEWYRRAAEGGDASAQAWLGSFYRSGEGVPANPITAYCWSALAAAQGDSSGKALVAVLEDTLSTAQVEKATAIMRSHGSGVCQE